MQLHDRIRKAITNANASSDALGDRSQYVGASDLATAFDCPRRVVYAKLNPHEDESFTKTLTKRRGHWIEAGITTALANEFQAQVLPQLEIAFSTQGTMFKFHLDYVLVSANKITVLELKTTHNSCTFLDSYKRQNQVQVTALQKYAGSPVFSLGDSYQLMTLAELVNHVCGIELASDFEVDGFVYIISTKDEDFLSDPIQPVDELTWREFITVGEQVMSDVKNRQLPSVTAQGFYPLCDYCTHQKDCPKFQVIESESLDLALERLGQINAGIEQLKIHKKVIEDDLTGYYQKVEHLLPENAKFIGGTTGKKYKASTCSRSSYSKNSIKEALEFAHASSNIANTVLEKGCTQTSFTKLTIVG